MKKMKKFSALLLTAAMTLSMAACGNSSAGTSTTEAASNASENTAETQTDTASSEAAESTASNGDLEDFSIVLTGIRMRCIPLSTLPLKKDTMRKKD